MDILPTSERLVLFVQNALDQVATYNKTDPLGNGDWFPEIVGRITSSIKELEADLRSADLTILCFATDWRSGKPVVGCHGREWMFDFSSLLYHMDVEIKPTFMRKAVIVGEIEWSSLGIDVDFKKLLVADALICFMTFALGSREHALEKMDFLRDAIERRREFENSTERVLPEYLLSCLIMADGAFVHQVV